MAGALTVGAVSVATDDDSSADAPVAVAAELSTDQLRELYGMYPLPVGQDEIAKYNLNEDQIRQVVKGYQLGESAKGRQVRACESGHDYTMIDGGYYGAWQFDRQTWLANGGGKFAPTADKAPRWAQDYILFKTWQARGWEPWSCA